MGKLRLTKRQLKILESHVGIENEKLDDDLSYIEEKCNNLYRTIMSSTVLEVAEGDVDVNNNLSVIKHLENKMDKIYSNEIDPSIEKAMSSEEISDRDKKILEQYNKIKVLKNVLEEIQKLTDFNTDKKITKIFGHKTAKLRG